MAQIIITFAPNLTAFMAAWNSIPADVVASGNSYWLQGSSGEIVTGSKIVLGGKTTGPSNGIKVSPAAGQGYLDNPNFATNRLAYVPANGLAIRSTGEGTIEINQDWLTFDGIQLSCSYGYSHNVINIGGGCPNTVVSNIIVEDALPQYSGGISALSGTVLNPTVILRSTEGVGIYVSGANTIVENATIVRTSTFAAGNAAFNYGDDSCKIFNSAAFGFGQFMFNDSPNFTGKNNATGLSLIPFGTGNKTSLVYADQFVNTADGTHDFRTKTGSALINSGAAPQSYNTTAPGGNRQQGTSTDIGSWEFIEVVQAPAATITSIVVSGTTATISGTFTGGATGGSATISPTSATGNNAEAQGPKAITIGSNTFSVAFTACKVGLYSVGLTVSNASYTNVQAQNNVGGFEIEGAKAVTVVQDPMAGQVYTVHGTVNGAVSGTLIVPSAAVNPNGAAQQTIAVTITGTTDPKNFTATVTLVPGSYDAGVLTFTNANGTSLPQAGTSPVTVLGFSGNPEGPPVDNPPADTPVTVTIYLKNPDGSALGGLTNIKWAWFDEPTPNLFTSVVDQGASETSEAVTGKVVISLPNSTLSSGEVGCLAYTDSDGTTAMNHKAFFGPVEVD